MWHYRYGKALREILFALPDIALKTLPGYIEFEGLGVSSH
jgi:hypothetical protein